MSGDFIEEVARLCHMANRILCRAAGDDSQVVWEDAPDWQRVSARKGVIFALLNKDAQPGDSHLSWLAEKHATGWVYGPVKDVELKTHPCILPFDQLPLHDQLKDEMFLAIVHGVAK